MYVLEAGYIDAIVQDWCSEAEEDEPVAEVVTVPRNHWATWSDLRLYEVRDLMVRDRCWDEVASIDVEIERRGLWGVM